MSKILGLVTFKQSPRLTASDSRLVPPLSALGLKIKAVPWDDEKVKWKEFDTLILRSCWNYHLYPEKFLTWLDIIENIGVKLWNPYPIVRWNLNKKYLLDLQKKGVKIVPTVALKKISREWIEKIMAKNGWHEAVIKPAIGASAYQIMSFSWNKIPKLPPGEYLIQPFIPEISEGELSLVFFNKKFNHAILKKPRTDDFRTQEELKGTVKLIQTDNKIIKQAQNILEKVDSPLLYARVDGLVLKGKFTLMELELVEPHLFMDLKKEVAGNFVRVLGELIQH